MAAEEGDLLVHRGRFEVSCRCCVLGTWGRVCNGPRHRQEVQDLRGPLAPRLLACVSTRFTLQGLTGVLDKGGDRECWFPLSGHRGRPISSFSHSIINSDFELGRSPPRRYSRPSLITSGGGPGSQGPLGLTVPRTPVQHLSRKLLVGLGPRRSGGCGQRAAGPGKPGPRTGEIVQGGHGHGRSGPQMPGCKGDARQGHGHRGRLWAEPARPP